MKQNAIQTDGMREATQRAVHLRELRDKLIDTHIDAATPGELMSLGEMMVALRRRELAIMEDVV